MTILKFDVEGAGFDQGIFDYEGLTITINILEGETILDIKRRETNLQLLTSQTTLDILDY